MTAIAWTALLALAGLTTGVSLRWYRSQGEMIAPLPIGLLTLALYVVPRAAYLLAFHRAPLTSGGLTAVRQVAVIAQTIVTTLIAALGLLCGYRARWAVRIGRRLDFNLPEPDPTRVLWIGWMAITVGGLILGYLLAQLGSIAYAVGHQEDVNSMLEGKQALLFQLGRIVMVGIILLLIDPRTGRSRWWVWVVAAATALALVPFGSRALVLLAMGLPLALYHLQVRPLPLRWLAIGAVAGSVGLFVMGITRLLSTQRLEQAASVVERHPISAMHFTFNAIGEFKIFDAASIIVRDVPDVIPYNYGVTFWRVPWMIVPRRLWHEKPVTSGRIIVKRYLPNLRTAYPPMAVGELFAAGGWLGVLVGFFALGWVSRVSWEWRQRHRGSGNAAVYLLFCFFVFDFTRVGDPSRTSWFFIIGAVMTAFVYSAAARFPSSSVPSRSLV